MSDEHVSMRTRYAVFDNDKFKEDVQDYRVRQNMSKVKLAEAAGMDVNTYFMWLKDRSRYLSLPSAAALAAYCDLSLDDYIHIVNKEPELKLSVWGHKKL